MDINDADIVNVPSELPSQLLDDDEALVPTSVYKAHQSETGHSGIQTPHNPKCMKIAFQDNQLQNSSTSPRNKAFQGVKDDDKGIELDAVVPSNSIMQDSANLSNKFSKPKKEPTKNYHETLEQRLEMQSAKKIIDMCHQLHKETGCKIAFAVEFTTMPGGIVKLQYPKDVKAILADPHQCPLSLLLSTDPGDQAVPTGMREEKQSATGPSRQLRPGSKIYAISAFQDNKLKNNHSFAIKRPSKVLKNKDKELKDDPVVSSNSPKRKCRVQSKFEEAEISGPLSETNYDFNENGDTSKRLPENQELAGASNNGTGGNSTEEFRPRQVITGNESMSGVSIEDTSTQVTAYVSGSLPKNNEKPKRNLHGYHENSKQRSETYKKTASTIRKKCEELHTKTRCKVSYKAEFTSVSGKTIIFGYP